MADLVILADLLAAACLVPQLRRRQRRGVGRVGARDADAAGLEEALRAVEALGRQLVVTERTEQLAHQDVRLLARPEVTHVTRHHRHLIAPHVRLQVPQAATMRARVQRVRQR